MRELLRKSKLLCPPPPPRPALQQERRTIEHLFWLKVITEKLSDNLEQNSSCILASLTSNKHLIY